MADEQDLIALRAGDPDMVQRDFRGADLEGQDCRQRDFSGAQFHLAILHGTFFEGSIFNRTAFVQIQGDRANFSRANVAGAMFIQASLKNAIFSHADCTRAHFIAADLSGADLRGADLRRSRIKEGTVFDGVITDEFTLFDDAQVFRPIAREHAFRFYRVERGVLVRREYGPTAEATKDERMSEEPANSSIHTSFEHDRARLFDAIEAVEKSVLDLPIDTQTRTAEIGHNNPPADAAFTAEDIGEVTRNLVELRREASSGNIDGVQKRASILASFGERSVRWIAGRYGEIQEGFFNQIGSSLANAIAAYLLFSSVLATLAAAVTTFVAAAG